MKECGLTESKAQEYVLKYWNLYDIDANEK